MGREVAPDGTKNMRLIRRTLLALLLLLILLAAAFWAYRVALLPQVNGTLKVPGLAAPVDIVRDREGVPHIFAHSEDDAHFALGFVHAQDRLWQMEMNRRIHSGRLAEILGPSALPTDKFLRTLGVRKNAEEQFKHYDAATQRALQRYADGVNAYLAVRRGPLPIEFLLTGAPAPEPWTPVDSVGWSTMMAWDLSGNWSNELMRMRLAQRLTKKQIDEFLPPYPGNAGKADAPLPTVDYTALYKTLKGTVDQLVAAARTAPPGFVSGMGSNNWVVSGVRSETGKPLLANDPHLDLAAPSLWYLAQMSAPGFDTIGATLPGLPFVVLGRTDRVAWGFTNTGPDTQDLYIEQVRGNQVRTPNGWRPLNIRTEVIKVKGRADVTLIVRTSRHGPLITDVSAAAKDAITQLGGDQFEIAFEWAALRPDDLTVQAAAKLNRVHNWAEFVAAMRDFDSPEQNMVYADVDGNIGFIAPGRVPVRRADNDLMGQAPAPGWEARYDWIGFIPFASLPRIYNPSSGEILSANEKIVPDDYRPFLTAEWEPPYRARRIEELLHSRPLHTLASFAAIQADQRSLAATDILPLLLQTTPSSPAARQALSRLARWDGVMSSDRIEPSIYEAWMRELSRLIYADELGPDLFADYWAQRQVFLVNVLRNVDGQGRWCDDVNTPEVETCETMKARSLDLALADLRRRAGPDMSQWKWGLLHIARSAHRPFSHVPVLNRIFDLRIATGGDLYTIDVGRNNLRDPGEPFANTHAPSLRALYDLSDLDKSEFIQSTGESGNRFSDLYSNFEKRWADVRYIPMQTRRSSVEEGAMGVLTLTP